MKKNNSDIIKIIINIFIDINKNIFFKPKIILYLDELKFQ